MQEPFESTPLDDACLGDACLGDACLGADPLGAPPREDVPTRREEIVAARRAALEAAHEAGPLHEIAHAFRLNAEALHTLKQMQGDLARSVQRGDRSELVLQSTRALNDTFRNLTGVQRELLSRLEQARGGSGRGPLVPLLLLGLLVVVLAGVYVILTALERDRQARPAPDLMALAEREREREAWKDGRREGAQASEREVRRLQEAADEAKARAQSLQDAVDAKSEQLVELERGKRGAELERDEFASQVRRAQNEVMAKQLLEEEIGSLRLQLEAANRAAAQAQQDAQVERGKNATLRDRMADHGMGISADDPPWRPGLPAGAPEPVDATPARDAPAKPPLTAKERERAAMLEMLVAHRKKMGLSVDDLVGPGAHLPGEAAPAGPGRAPPPAADASSAVPPPAMPVPATQPARAPQPAPAGAAYGGDVPATHPAAPTAGAPPSPGPAPARAQGSVEQVRAHLNGLLAGGGEAAPAGWRITSLGGVAEDHLGAVTLVHYDRAGQVVESIQAREVRIAFERDPRVVRFTLRGGRRVDRGGEAALPPTGLPLIVAQGEGARAWGASSLPLIQKR